MKKVHRIYTQDADKDAVISIVTENFESFTVQPTTGYYQGKPESSIVIEIVGAKQPQIDRVAKDIRKITSQSSVLVVSLKGRSKQVKPQGKSKSKDPAKPAPDRKSAKSPH